MDKKMINSYDFDKTIYDGDASIDFYIYMLKKYKKIILLLPYQIYGMVSYKLKIKSKEYFKECFFSFLKESKNIASPYFLLEPIATKLKVNLIATEVDKKNGKFKSKNCYGEEKVRRFREEYKNTTINEFYSDSMSDRPMMNISKKAFLVKGDVIEEINLNEK